MGMRRIYLDHAATTPVLPEVAAEVAAAMSDVWANPSSVHAEGRRARVLVERARQRVAALIGADAEEIVFTSGATEADNLAVLGVARALRERGDHVVTSAVEHRAVLDACRALEREGYRVTYLPVDGYGRVDPDDVRRAIGPRTVLVSVMLANNEVGTLQPVREIAEICRARGVLVHTDAVQAVGVLPVDVRDLGVDLLSLSGHKIYAPKGVGALYIRRGVRRFLAPLLYGGGQEGRMRPGTENVPAIAGLGRAAEIALRERDELARRLRAWRDRLEQELLARIPGARVNGHPQLRLPGHLNLAVPGVDPDALLIGLDLAGVAASNGSACSAGSIEPSHVLLAMGLSPELARGAVRLTLGRLNREEDVEEAAARIAGVVARLRRARAAVAGARA